MSLLACLTACSSLPGSIAERFWAQNGDEPNCVVVLVVCLAPAVVVAARGATFVPPSADLDDSLASAPDSICTTMPLQFVLLLLLLIRGRVHSLV